MMHSDRERLRKIVATWESLNAQIMQRKICRADVLNDTFTQWAITTPLYNIGEQTNNITRELQDKYQDIPWKKVAGLRHRLVHHYEGTNWEIIAAILYENMPKYIEQLKAVLAEQDNDTQNS
jgi:uncharacterized protein with HEPN domain